MYEEFKTGSEDEGEQSAAKRLLSDITKTYKNLFDVVGYDAIVRAKSNYNKSLQQVKKKVNKLEPVEVWND